MPVLNTKIMIITILSIVAILVLWSLWGVFASRVEQIEYTVLNENDIYQIRLYPSHIVAQATVSGFYKESRSSGFRIVAGYIFGGNTKKESIAMTAPVLTESAIEENLSEKIAMTAPVLVETGQNLQTISFAMPKSYTMETLPTPNDSRVQIVQIPEKKFAVLKFSGYRSDNRIKKKEMQLRSALERDGMTIQGSVAYAGYNAPGTPPWMTRNEVLLEVLK